MTPTELSDIISKYDKLIKDVHALSKTYEAECKVKIELPGIDYLYFDLKVYAMDDSFTASYIEWWSEMDDEPIGKSPMFGMEHTDRLKEMLSRIYEEGDKLEAMGCPDANDVEVFVETLEEICKDYNNGI